MSSLLKPKESQCWITSDTDSKIEFFPTVTWSALCNCAMDWLMAVWLNFKWLKRVIVNQDGALWWGEGATQPGRDNKKSLLFFTYPLQPPFCLFRSTAAVHLAKIWRDSKASLAGKGVLMWESATEILLLPSSYPLPGPQPALTHLKTSSANSLPGLSQHPGTIVACVKVPTFYTDSLWTGIWDPPP